jgi:hypothetical protein
VISGLESSPKEAADQVVELVLRGLRSRAGEEMTTGEMTR